MLYCISFVFIVMFTSIITVARHPAKFDLKFKCPINNILFIISICHVFFLDIVILLKVAKKIAAYLKFKFI